MSPSPPRRRIALAPGQRRMRSRWPSSRGSRISTRSTIGLSSMTTGTPDGPRRPVNDCGDCVVRRDAAAGLIRMPWDLRGFGGRAVFYSHHQRVLLTGVRGCGCSPYPRGPLRSMPEGALVTRSSLRRRRTRTSRNCHCAAVRLASDAAPYWCRLHSAAAPSCCCAALLLLAFLAARRFSLRRRSRVAGLQRSRLARVDDGRVPVFAACVPSARSCRRARASPPAPSLTLYLPWIASRCSAAAVRVRGSRPPSMSPIDRIDGCRARCSSTPSGVTLPTSSAEKKKKKKKIWREMARRPKKHQKVAPLHGVDGDERERPVDPVVSGTRSRPGFTRVPSSRKQRDARSRAGKASTGAGGLAAGAPTRTSRHPRERQKREHRRSIPSPPSSTRARARALQPATRLRRRG